MSDVEGTFMSVFESTKRLYDGTVENLCGCQNTVD